jgi:hypothetical protein
MLIGFSKTLFYSYASLRGASGTACFVNVASVGRILYSIFQRFNLEWKNRTLKLLTLAA